jgi:hypothetical protein
MLYRELGRRELQRKLCSLTPEEKARLAKLTPGGRLNWALTFLREAIGPNFTASRVGKRMGINVGSLYHLIRTNARPHDSTALALERELGLPMRFLYTGEVPGADGAVPALDHLGEDLQDFLFDPATRAYTRGALELAKRFWDARIGIQGLQALAELYLQQDADTRTKA